MNERVANHYLLIYWLLFIYLSLQSLDEMIELFSVLMQLEKGALGLFFEMNYIVGSILCIYNMWFVINTGYPKLIENEDKKTEWVIKEFVTTSEITQDHLNWMHNWLVFHMIYVFVSVAIALTVLFIYKNINAKITKRSKKEEEAITQDLVN